MILDQKRIVFVGGSSGIGLATARAAAAEGATVIIASSSADKVDAAIAELPEGSEGRVLDARSEAAVGAFFEEVDPFDHLVYTAGQAPAPQELANFDLPAAREALELSYWGVVRTVKHAGAKIREGGSIVLTSGSIGARPRKGFAVSAGMSSAMEGLTRGLAVELAPVRVNAVAPGTVRTPMWDIMPPPELDALFETMGAGLLTGRVGAPADLAEVYLALMRSGFITGAVVPVDGGVRLV